MRLYLDDERVEPHGWFRTTTAENCLALLEMYHDWGKDNRCGIDELSLDHDLDTHIDTRLVGYENNTPMDGYAVACWLEQKAVDDKWGYIPRVLKCHSDNPAGRKRIEQALAKIQKMREAFEASMASNGSW